MNDLWLHTVLLQPFYPCRSTTGWSPHQKPGRRKVFLGNALSLFPIWVVATQTPFGGKILFNCIYKICPFLFLEVKRQKAACKTLYGIKRDGISRQVKKPITTVLRSVPRTSQSLQLSFVNFSRCSVSRILCWRGNHHVLSAFWWQGGIIIIFMAYTQWALTLFWEIFLCFCFLLGF